MQVHSQKTFILNEVGIYVLIKYPCKVLMIFFNLDWHIVCFTDNHQLIVFDYVHTFYIGKIKYENILVESKNTTKN